MTTTNSNLNNIQENMTEKLTQAQEAIQEQLDSITADTTQTAINGNVTKAKGIVQEHLGNLTNDDKTRLTGKKNQIVGQLQVDYGNSWVIRYKNWVLAGTAILIIGMLLAPILSGNKNTASS